jgi:hypothetical protein
MSARLNHNTIRYTSWKGKTLSQITTQIQKNNRNDTTISRQNLFHAQPLKIYRREMVTGANKVAVCNNRTSASIETLDMPNGYSITSNSTGNASLVHVLEANVTQNKSQNGDCTNQNANVCVADNARRRVRSSGMIKRAFKPQNNNDNAYFTNTAQYLVSRNRTFKQNQYAHIHKGENSLMPNGTLYNTNVYSPNGVSHCKKTQIITGVNDTFYYVWTTFNPENTGSVISNPDTATNCFKVTVPAGYKTFEDIQSAFYAVLVQNGHYYIDLRTNTRVFLLKMIFNVVENKIELQSFTENILVSNTGAYMKPDGFTPALANGYADYKRPSFYFPANSGFSSTIGFASSNPAFYPNIQGGTNLSTESIGFLSNTSVGIFPFYDILHYKPSNTRFATQGAVSASSRVLRVKYDTITRNGYIFQKTFGSGVAAAMSYGVPGEVYTIKNKIGYPTKRTPVFPKYITNVQVQCCEKE